jgi:hypothetical protein
MNMSSPFKDDVSSVGPSHARGRSSCCLQLISFYSVSHAGTVYKFRVGEPGTRRLAPEGGGVVPMTPRSKRPKCSIL